MSAPRRTCPACSKRYAQLVSGECPICRGLGVLNLGPAALAQVPAPAVARAVDLYLEDIAQEVRAGDFDIIQHRQALEAAADELRMAGILASDTDLPPVSRPTPVGYTLEDATLDAHVLTYGTLDRIISRELSTTLDAPPRDLQATGRRHGQPPQTSANGHPQALALISDPIDMSGPDTDVLRLQSQAHDYQGRVLANAVIPTLDVMTDPNPKGTR